MIIAIGGISNAGKSKLAIEIAELYTKQSSIILCQDNFANSTPNIPKIKGHTNWEIPESININKFYQKIIESATQYEIVIAEGLFVYFENKLTELYDKSIYMTISKETFLDRKKDDLRWGKEPDWYIEYIWESHFQFCSEINSRKNAFHVSGEIPVDFNSVIQYLES